MEHTNSKKQLEALNPGDLVRIEWTDASIGKSLGSGIAVDVPACSWGIFIGILGKKDKCIILGQNNYCYADGLYDIDYTAIPVTWTVNIRVIEKNHVHAEEVKVLLNSFMIGGRRTLPKRKRQRRLKNYHARLD